jgi:hypothetical protein
LRVCLAIYDPFHNFGNYEKDFTKVLP